MTPELSRLGDELQRAVAADIAATPAPRRRRAPRKLVLVTVALLIAVPGIAYAAIALTDEQQVAASLPAGTKMLIGTDPKCTAVRDDVEYRCVLSHPPSGPDFTGTKGSVYPTVDETKHVNGGCRSLSSDGLSWQCYIGQEAVAQQVIGADLLGEYAPFPTQG